MFYDRIRDVRKDNGIGQKEMAAVLRITQQQYSLYETGKRSFPAEMIPDICRYLCVSSDYIFGLTKK